MGGRKPLELTGQRFNRLTVISKAENRNGFTYWNCICDCGNIKTVKGVSLTKGYTKSCGCYSRELTAKRNKDNADGKFRDERLYRIFYGMMTRCYNPNESEYLRYGGRGISVCKEWRNNFFAFQEWALNNGYNETLTIDRINNDGDYEPNNCHWATMKQQSNNRRSNLQLTFNGETKSASEWSEIVGLNRSVIYGRIKHNWSVKDALTTPLMEQYSRKKNECIS